MAITYRTVKGAPLTWQELDDNFAELGNILSQAEQARDDAIDAKDDAEIAALAAENDLKDFETKYLGPKSVEPTVDNEGNPLLDGALYYNTVDNILYVYDLGTTTWAGIGGDTTGFVQKAGDTMTGPLRFPTGSAGTPSISFAGNTNTGIYSSATNTINVTTNGTSRFLVDTTNIIFTLPLRGGAGNQSNPTFSFSGDTNTGLYAPTSDQLAVTTGGSIRMYWSNTEIRYHVPIRANTNGGPSAPMYSFLASNNSGMYYANVSGPEVRFSVNGVDKLQITEKGIVTPTVLQDSPFTLRNKLINGNFRIWQRGTNQTSSGYGSADRWLNYHAGAGVSKTVSMETVAPGDPSLPMECDRYLRQVFTVGADAATEVVSIQAIEDVRSLANRKVTVSFYARSPTGLKIGVNFRQGFGTGGSAPVDVNGQSVTLTNVFQRYTFVFDIPDINGKTIGNNSQLGLSLWFSAGAPLATRSGSIGLQSGEIHIACVQVEEGEVATPFEFRPVQVEQALCQRYYYKATSEYAGQAISATTGLISYPFPTSMRVPPTATLVTNGHLTTVSGATAAVTGIISSVVNEVGARLDLGSASVVAGNATLHVNGVVAFDAEL